MFSSREADGATFIGDVVMEIGAGYYCGARLASPSSSTLQVIRNLLARLFCSCTKIDQVTALNDIREAKYCRRY